MLHLEKDKSNTMDLVVSDIVCIPNPIFLWRFEHTQDRTEFLIELDNLLPTNPRADRFDLTLPTQLDLETGQYRYQVYESDMAGRTDFENMRILAEGRADVLTQFEPDTVYEQQGTDTTYRGNQLTS